MAATPTVTRKRPAPPAGERGRPFDRRLGEILRHATDVFYEKGYEGA